MATSLATSAPSEEKAHGFEVLLHFRSVNGPEETSRLENFHFIYYDRRFVKKSTGFGKPGKVQIRDVPHDSTSIQNDEGKKLKFKQLQDVRFEYQGEKGNRHLVLIATFKNKKKAVTTWIASDLRNTHVSSLPHFRGEADGKTVDVPLPSLMESDTPQEKTLISLDFKFTGQKKHRDWF
ncbi:MAG: hypothetical protein L0Z52_07350 [Acidobacteria bacterium]|nr:hypothetical protein [Acidobacteriota bacterium]